MLGKWLDSVPAGPKEANNELRRRLRVVGVRKAQDFTLHAFRRGHAMDLVARGARLWEILQAGEWRSPAFLAYLKLHKVECEATQEAQAAAPQILEEVFGESDAEGDFAV